MKKNFLLAFLIFIFGYNQAENLQDTLSGLSFKTGRLSNGLTYYIRHNPASAGHTSYYLVQNVGALLEEDHQNGLAHFLEHMAFNGTLHYPGKSMLSMLEKQGITLNRGINAYTSLNETLYGLDNVPNAPGMADSCLLILHDWSHFLSLDKNAIEAERPVILEEWRTRRDADFRLKAKTTPVWMKGSRYAVRDIIGDTTVIKNLQQEDLRKFYRTWYRPDLQAILIIGDLDPEQTEQLLKKQFADISAPPNAPGRPFFEIPLNEKFTFVQATDPETPRVRIRISTRQRATDTTTSPEAVLLENLQTELFNRLMRERLFGMFRQNNIPALGYSLVRHTPERGYKALTLTVIPRPGDEEKVVKAMLTEKERAKRHGFTEGELQRAKTMLLNDARKACDNQDKQPNAYYIERYSQNFLENTPVPEPADYLKFLQRQLSAITSEQMAGLLKKWDDGTNYTVSVTGPVNMAPIDSARIREWITTASQWEIAPYREEQPAELLIPSSLTEGKIVKETLLKELGAKEWILSNGAKVVFKPLTDGQGLSLLAFRAGGTSGCTPEESAIAGILPALVNNYGISNLDALQLGKILSVKDINCGITLKPTYEAMAGHAPSAEAESLLKMIWLRFEQPRFDANVHKGLINNFKSQWTMRSKDPFQQINDTLVATLNNYAPRFLPLQTSQFDQITLEETEKLYRKKFADPASFTFLITGQGDEEQIKKLTEKYIGSFPSAQLTQKPILEKAIFPAWKKLTKTRTMPFPEPKSTVLINLVSELPYSPENEHYHNVMSTLLQAACMKELREKDGAVYQVSVQNEFEAKPAGKAIIMVYFDCAPEREQELTDRVNRIIDDLTRKGPEEEELQKALKNLKATENRSTDHNSRWINTLFFWYFHGINKADKNYTEQLYNKTSVKSCRTFFRKFMNKAHQTNFFFKPENT